MVYSFDKPLSIMCSDKLLGNILDGMGKPLNGCVHKFYETPISIHHRAVNPLNRPRIKEHIQTGVRAIDGLLTVGKGQRMGIMSGTGVGKSIFLSMIARKYKRRCKCYCAYRREKKRSIGFYRKRFRRRRIKKKAL